MRSSKNSWRAPLGGRSDVQAQGDLRGRAVLLAVDDPGLRQKLTAMLRDAGCQRVSEAELADGLGWCGRGDGVVIAHSVDGLVVVGLVRRIRRTAPAVGIIICMDDVRWFDETFEAGADAWVSTQVEPAALCAALRWA